MIKYEFNNNFELRLIVIYCKKKIINNFSIKIIYIYYNLILIIIKYLIKINIISLYKL